MSRKQPMMVLNCLIVFTKSPEIVLMGKHLIMLMISLNLLEMSSISINIKDNTLNIATQENLEKYLLKKKLGQVG